MDLGVSDASCSPKQNLQEIQNRKNTIMKISYYDICRSVATHKPVQRYREFIIVDSLLVRRLLTVKRTCGRKWLEAHAIHTDWVIYLVWLNISISSGRRPWERTTFVPGGNVDLLF